MKASTIWDKRWVRVIAATVFWLGLWQAVSLALPKLLFAGPAQTMQSLFSMIGSADFWLSIGYSIGKIAGGFALALCWDACLRFWRIARRLRVCCWNPRCRS